MKQKTVLTEKVATSMSEALQMAIADPNFKEAHGSGYLDYYGEGGGPSIYGCAIGAVATHIVPYHIAKKYAKQADDDEDIRDTLIVKICKKIKGSCDDVPFKVWCKHCINAYGPDEEEDYKDDTRHRWIDFIEELFENHEKTFKQIITILKKYGK